MTKIKISKERLLTDKGNCLAIKQSVIKVIVQSIQEEFKERK